MNSNVRYIPGGSMVARELTTGDYIVHCYRGKLGWRLIHIAAPRNPGDALDAAVWHPFVRAAWGV